MFLFWMIVILVAFILFFVPILMFMHAEKCIKEVDDIIDEQEDKILDEFVEFLSKQGKCNYRIEK